MTEIVSRIMVLATCGALAACAAGEPQSIGVQPAPLQPAPVAPVSSSSLPPVGNPAPGGSVPTNPSVPGATASTGQDLQAIPTIPQSSAGVTSGQDVTVGPDIEFGRNAVLGAWNVAAQSDACALNLSLTTWTGGFRASTRKCTADQLVSIGAWALAGKQLTLMNTQGNTIARLVASGPNRFDGTTESGGQPISVFR